MVGEGFFPGRESGLGTEIAGLLVSEPAPFRIVLGARNSLTSRLG
jgi:hypothetical protein